jgi:hypothetical protein
VADGCTAALRSGNCPLNCWVTDTKETPGGVEQLHQVCQGRGEPVDLVDDDNIDPAVPDISQQAERWPIAPALAV